MKTIIFAVLCLFLASSLFAAGEEVFYQTDFNTPASLTNWFKAPNMTLETTGGLDNSGCVKFVAESDSVNNLSTIRLDANKLQGRSVVVEGWIKTDNVGKPKAAYLGPKLMLSITYGNDQKNYPDQEKKVGTYDWQKFTVFVRIPRSSSKVDLSIGLQGAAGTVYFDDVKVILLPAPAEAAAAKPAAQPYTQTTRFRGVMSGGDLSPAALKELHEVWSANLIRFQIGRKSGEDHTTPEGYRQIVARGLAELDAILPAARQNNLKILIDMHVGPGTSLDKLLSNKLSWDPKMQQLLADIWREIAAKYKDEPVIWGYDLLNEPREENYVYTPNGGLDWNRLAEKVAKSVREVDPAKPIIVEAAQWANPAGFENLLPVNVPNVIYSVHLYAPHEYTHQGVHNNPSSVPYPGMIAGKMWDKAALEKELAPVIAFQQKYHVPIYVGEFGVARWAPGAERWLDDVISIFEANGWDWTYHAFREYDGWDAEISADKANPQRVKDTPRRAVLLKYMKNNGNSEALKSQLDTTSLGPQPGLGDGRR